MKRTISFALSMLVTLCFLSQSKAQPPQAGGNFMRMLPLMAALDANKDGEISADEIAKASEALKTLDKNGDGKLTLEELRPNMEGMPMPGGRGPTGASGFSGGGNRPMSPADMADRIMDQDKNGDGRIAKDELPENMQRIFARADADEDGFLTRDEVEKIASSIPGPGGLGLGPNAGPTPNAAPGGAGGPNGGQGRFGQGMGMGMFADGPAAMIDRLFRLDADNDGKLTREELGKLKDLMGGGAAARRGRPSENDRPK